MNAGYMVANHIHTTRADRTHVRTAGGGIPVWRRALTHIPLAQTALTCILLEEVFPYGGET